jgi:hypothetical protein
VGWKCPSVSLRRLVRLGHEGVINTWRAAGRRCPQDAAGMPEASIAGRHSNPIEFGREYAPQIL